MLFCEDVELMLQDYLGGVLLPSQREMLEAHVRGCGKCQGLMTALTRMESRLEGIADVDVPPGLSHSILGALPAHTYGPSPLRRAVAWGAVPLAAMLLVAAGFLVQGRLQLRGLVAEREIEITFAAPQAVMVTIAGDFNGWNPVKTRLVRSNHEGLWRARLKLAPGVYQYSFVLDGKVWVDDPQAKTLLADGFGGNNSVIIVDADG